MSKYTVYISPREEIALGYDAVIDAMGDLRTELYRVALDAYTKGVITREDLEEEFEEAFARIRDEFITASRQAAELEAVTTQEGRTEVDE